MDAFFAPCAAAPHPLRQPLGWRCLLRHCRAHASPLSSCGSPISLSAYHADPRDLPDRRAAAQPSRPDPPEGPCTAAGSIVLLVITALLIFPGRSTSTTPGSWAAGLCRRRLLVNRSRSTQTSPRPRRSRRPTRLPYWPLPAPQPPPSTPTHHRTGARRTLSTERDLADDAPVCPRGRPGHRHRMVLLRYRSYGKSTSHHEHRT
jgi:hypothetical protein